MGERTTVELRKVEKGITTHFRARVVGTKVETETGRDGRKPRTAMKAFDDKHKARVGFDKAVHAKLRDGFVEMREADGTQACVVFRAATPWGGNTFDVARDGRFLVAGGIKNG